ncbi:unnamed protein product [Blepharisma stoltei]|uniref:Uncharacterized protein n=1 Tax=Blepharisma stoltei TaxID=1481888 RepID=A0AAU9J0L7_9CILI|nr:unnamed protein product [Blepharisma stoltei]
MEELLDDLISGEKTEKIFSKYARNGKINIHKCISYILQDLNAEFDIDLRDVKDYFKMKKNPFDHDEIINPEEVSLEQFKTRLENYLTKGMGIMINAENDTNFIRALNHPISLDQKQISTIISNDTEEKWNTPNSERLSKSKQRTPINLKSRITQSVNTSNLLGKAKQNWLEPYLKEYHADIENILLANDPTGKKMIEAIKLKRILREILQLMKLPEEKDLFLFDRMIENRFKHIKGSPAKSSMKYLRVTFSQCFELFEEWAAKESFSRLSYHAQLQNTINEYKELINTYGSDMNCISDLKDMIDQMEIIHSSSNTKSIKISEENLMEKQVKGLKAIFSFYASQTQELTRSPTFDHLINLKQFMTLSQFLKFCNDFGISDKKGMQRLNPQQASKVFINNSKCGRKMTLSQFFSAVDCLAEIFYNIQVGAEESEIGLVAKRNLFYQYLQCDNQEIYMQKTRGFKYAFSNEKAGFRMPEYDLSKKYKFKDQTEVKQRILDWKREKEERNPKRSISVPNKLKLDLRRMKLMQRKDRITWEMLRNMESSSFINDDEAKDLINDSYLLPALPV